MNHPFQLFSIHHMCEYFKAWHQGQAAESCPCPTEHANSELAVCFYSLCHPRRCLVLARRGSISDWALWDEKTSCLADWLCCWKWKSHRCFASLKGWWSQCHILGLSNLTTRLPNHDTMPIRWLWYWNLSLKTASWHCLMDAGRLFRGCLSVNHQIKRMRSLVWIVWGRLEWSTFLDMAASSFGCPKTHVFRYSRWPIHRTIFGFSIIRNSNLLLPGDFLPCFC